MLLLDNKLVRSIKKEKLKPDGKHFKGYYIGFGQIMVKFLDDVSTHL